MPDKTQTQNDAGKDTGDKKGWLRWLCCVLGWLACAAMCLWLTVAMETWPYAYDMLFPVVIFLLFGNIFIFLFIASRWAADTGRLVSSIVRVCIGEGLALGCMYCFGRFIIGA